MLTKFVCLALLPIMLTGSVCVGLTAPCAAQTDASPYQSRPFVMDGLISHVDVDRERVVLNGDDGKTYTLDTAEADITLMDGNRAGMTPDLARGMRVHASGRQIASGIAEVERLRVLNTARPDTPRPRSAAPVGAEIELRGTVASVDTRNGTFVVRVQNHTRTILLADDTDLSGMAMSDPERFPVKIGDRVTVAGRLQPDGGVLAGAISLSKTIALPAANVPTDHVLVGQISSPSSRYTSRDIKIWLSDDREVKIKVPRGIPIRRDGRAISVHDLHDNDRVRVTGSYGGSDFKAQRIDVLHQAGSDDTPALTRGL